MQSKLKPSSLRIGIDKLRKIGGGGIAIELGSKDEAAILERNIEEKVPELMTKRPKKRWPHMVIYSVQTDINREELPTLIYEQNDIINGQFTTEEFEKQFRIKFILGKRDSKYKNWVVEVSPDIRKTLLHLGKISIEWSRCRTADFCPVLQCFKCCEYNHTAKDCPHSTPKCSHCSGEHLYRECPNKETEPVCCNCRRDNALNYKHNARDSTCSINTRIKNNIMARIDYGNK
ncbi:uncharacterized protein LOC111631162 [Centruroides sculpturatus]|uniref:uncharacterized protein LOC111631162 n=1 Tax=Centruroides sculpturatus TaxID=218467 RepID=UPI000C6DE124|nr:uncharacterized protein LOC111631162 [Centruroides sculpturatus]